MGFFSWKDCRDGSTIANTQSGHPNAEDTVYLLQPNGKPNIAERAYEGYGEFGGVDAYVWLGEMNKGKEIVGDYPEALRDYGRSFDSGSVYVDQDENYYAHEANLGKLNIVNMEGNYGTVQPKFGKTPNELIEDGIWTEVPLADIVKKHFPDFEFLPIKLSYDKDAKYEDYDASPNCSSQGYFYEDKEIEDALLKKVHKHNEASRQKASEPQSDQSKNPKP